jgi:hypothetical protein
VKSRNCANFNFGTRRAANPRAKVNGSRAEVDVGWQPTTSVVRWNLYPETQKFETQKIQVRGKNRSGKKGRKPTRSIKRTNEKPVMTDDCIKIKEEE